MKYKGFWLAAAIFIAYMALIPFSYIQGNEKGYEEGIEAGKIEAMKQIELSNGITNTDSSIAKLKQMPSDSVAIAVFNLYATDREREMVKQFAMWIRKVKEVK